MLDIADLHRVRYRTMTLPTFVAESHDAYARQPPEKLVCRSVDAWLADRKLSAFLRDAAGAQPRPVEAARGVVPASEPTNAGLRFVPG
ncbi:hypothetical protein [uncultured Methylobacterium sp.]|uniref:hypothetical protein n=1 Tax=uncultured Methylobacterium sp. TaxID=157278 RepID=UPI0035CC9D2B